MLKKSLSLEQGWHITKIKSETYKSLKGTRFHLAYDEWTCSVRISLFSLFSSNSSIFFYCATTTTREKVPFDWSFVYVHFKGITFEWRIIENCWLMRLLMEMELRLAFRAANNNEKSFPFSAAARMGGTQSRTPFIDMIESIYEIIGLLPVHWTITSRISLWMGFSTGPR